MFEGWEHFKRCPPLPRSLRQGGEGKKKNHAAFGVSIGAASFRTACDSMMRVMPLINMLTPTKVPSAQAELEGQWT